MCLEQERSVLFTILTDPVAVSVDLNSLINKVAFSGPSVHKITHSLSFKSDTVEDTRIILTAV